MAFSTRCSLTSRTRSAESSKGDVLLLFFAVQTLTVTRLVMNAGKKKKAEKDKAAQEKKGWGWGASAAKHDSATGAPPGQGQGASPSPKLDGTAGAADPKVSV